MPVPPRENAMIVKKKEIRGLCLTIPETGVRMLLFNGIFDYTIFKFLLLFRINKF